MVLWQQERDSLQLLPVRLCVEPPLSTTLAKIGPLLMTGDQANLFFQVIAKRY